MTAERLSTTAPRAVLERLIRSGVSPAGLTVLSMEPIRAHCGARWVSKQELVWDFTERHVRQDMRALDQIIRLDEVNYLLVQPERSRHEAESLAIHLLRAVHGYFLGSAAPADIGIGRVSGIGPEGIDYVVVPSARDCGIDTQPPGAEQPKVRGGAPQPSLVVADQRYRIVFSIEPIWNVYKRAVGAFVLNPLVFTLGGDVVPADLDEVSLKDLTAIDAAVLAAATELLPTDGTPGCAVHVPVHLRVASTDFGRHQLGSKLASARQGRSGRLVACLKGLDRGTPPSRIAQAAAFLKPHCQGVVARCSTPDADLSSWGDARLSAVALDLGELPFDGDTLHLLARFAEKASGVATALIAHRVRDRPALTGAWAAGFTHVSGDVITSRVIEQMVAVRVPPETLWPAAPATSSPHVDQAGPAENVTLLPQH